MDWCRTRAKPFPTAKVTRACFLSLARSKFRLCSANHRAGYFSNLACDWLSIVWAYSELETENGPYCRKPLMNRSHWNSHYSGVILGTMAFQIASLTIVYSTVHSGADQRKHQSSASLAFVRRMWPVNFPHKWPVKREMFPFMTSSCINIFFLRSDVSITISYANALALDLPYGYIAH